MTAITFESLSRARELLSVPCEHARVGCAMCVADAITRAEIVGYGRGFQEATKRFVGTGARGQGYSAALEDAAAALDEVVKQDFPTGGAVENVVALVVERCINRVLALAPPSPPPAVL